MMASGFFFYLFSCVMIVSALMVISSGNPVRSVLFLTLCVLNVAALFVMAGIKFFGLALVLVYAGAVSVLFLFAARNMDFDFARLREGYQQYLPLGTLVGIVVLVELLAVAGNWMSAPGAQNGGEAPISDAGDPSNMETLGNILYAEHIFLFQLAGIILLVAMIGAIVLTLHRKEDANRQNIAQQVERDAKTATQLRKVKPGKEA